MREDQAESLLDAIHGSWSTLGLKKAGVPNADVWGPWVKYLEELDYEITKTVVRDFFLGELTIPSGLKAPQFKDIRSVVRSRMQTRPQPESFANAKRRPISLPFEDGDYVTIPVWFSGCLPGGRVHKMEAYDEVVGIPCEVHWHDFDGYILLSRTYLDPYILKGMKQMAPIQRDSWVKQIKQWESEKRIKHFRMPRDGKRGGLSSVGDVLAKEG